MKVKTKYNIGDELYVVAYHTTFKHYVWYCGEVRAIKITKDGIRYICQYAYYPVQEEDCFVNKDEAEKLKDMRNFATTKN